MLQKPTNQLIKEEVGITNEDTMGSNVMSKSIVGKKLMEYFKKEIEKEGKDKFRSIVSTKRETRLKHSNHMTMTTSGQIMPWPDCLKTKGNVNIKLRDLCETLIVYILFSTF